MPVTHQHVTIDDVVIHFVEAGAHNNRTIIFLHGFPENWQTWQQQLVHFSAEFRVVAPDLPGYNLSDKPSNINFYQIPNLISFFVKFIRAISPHNEVVLVAHDWGGAIAWPLVAFYPELFSNLIILNAAHPSTFTREMIQNEAQRKKSAYIHELISINAVERLSKNNNKYLFDKILTSMSANTLTEHMKKEYRTAWQQQGAINGMLQYYRAMPQLATTTSVQKQANGSPLVSVNDMSIPNIVVHQPTLVLWGMQDQAFVPNCLDGLDGYVDNLKVVKYPKASHWLHHEESEDIIYQIEQFIN